MHCTVKWAANCIRSLLCSPPTVVLGMDEMFYSLRGPEAFNQLRCCSYREFRAGVHEVNMLVHAQALLPSKLLGGSPCSSALDPAVCNGQVSRDPRQQQ